MFIKDALYKTVDISRLTLPVPEGTVLTASGSLAPSNGKDAFGILTETVANMPATGKAYVAVSGTIDLATCGVTFSDDLIKALGKDFNFVPAVETESKKELPDVTGADNGKVLTVSGGKWAKSGSVPVEVQTAFIYWDEGQSKYDTSGYLPGYDQQKPLFLFLAMDDAAELVTSDCRWQTNAGTGNVELKALFKAVDTAAGAVAFIEVDWTLDGNYDPVITVETYSVEYTSLPAYEARDAGKVLALVEEPERFVLLPRQEITLTDAPYPAFIDLSSMGEDDYLIVKLDGTTELSLSYSNDTWWRNYDGLQYRVTGESIDVYNPTTHETEPGTYDVSIFIETQNTVVKPEWTSINDL